MKRPASLLMPLVAAVWLVGCATAPPPTTIADTAARTPELSTLNKLIADAGLGDTLRGPGPFTVFAPTDAAFKALPAKTLEELSKDKDRLKAVLTYHVLPAKVMAADVKTSNVKTVNGSEVAVSKAGTFVTFDEALVTQADIGATNGVVHLIDKVIVPPARR
jgi:uncharacterized surface protein with fasciclin (FAS1) repeats